MRIRPRQQRAASPHAALAIKRHITIKISTTASLALVATSPTNLQQKTQRHARVVIRPFTKKRRPSWDTRRATNATKNIARCLSKNLAIVATRPKATRRLRGTKIASVATIPTTEAAAKPQPATTATRKKQSPFTGKKAAMIATAPTAPKALNHHRAARPATSRARSLHFTQNRAIKPARTAIPRTVQPRAIEKRV